MNRDQLESKLLAMVCNLNLEGLKLIDSLFGDMDEADLYNVNTSFDQYIALKKAEHERIEKEANKGELENVH